MNKIDLSLLNIPYETFKYLFDEKIGLYINGTPYYIESMIAGNKKFSVYGCEIKSVDWEKTKLKSNLQKTKLLRDLERVRFKESECKVLQLQIKLKKAKDTIKKLKKAVAFDPDLVKVCDDWLNS